MPAFHGAKGLESQTATPGAEALSCHGAVDRICKRVSGMSEGCLLCGVVARVHGARVTGVVCFVLKALPWP